jgi:hypothetical protein
METAWLFDTLAVTVCDIDFLDPALAGRPNVRERGVRIELRTVDTVATGSIYASPSLTLRPAVCRIDLLESEPGAADRMHVHPVMSAGEPGDRTFDPTMVDDPLAWLSARLTDVRHVLRQAGVEQLDRFDDDTAEIADRTAEIVARVEEGLQRARRPWPEVRHGNRGLAPVS